MLLVLGVGVWWMFWGRSQGPLKVKAVAVAPTSMQENVYATGSVVPVSRQDVSVLTPARVDQVAVKVGDSVQAGQTLVVLDTTLAKAQTAQAEANVEAAQTSVKAAQQNLAELKSSVSSGAVSGTVQQGEGALSQSKSSLKQAQAALKVAQVQQGELTYKSRMAGTVLEVNAQSGNLSPTQQPLVSVADLTQMNVKVQLNEADAGKVQLDQKVKVTGRVLGNTPVQGSVAQIAPEAVTGLNTQGNASPAVGVKIHLDQVPKVLKPGYTVSIQIGVAAKPRVLAVPLEALFQEGSKNYVYKIQGGLVEKREVQVGIGNETQQEITAGLKAGDLVVVNPSSELTPGTPVAPDLGSAGT